MDSVPGSGDRNENIELPDYEEIAKLMTTRKNMTLMCMDNSPSILRKDGFEFPYDKYKDKIYKDMEQMSKDCGLDDRRETILPKDSHKPDMNVSTTTELPFDTDKAKLFGSSSEKSKTLFPG